MSKYFAVRTWKRSASVTVGGGLPNGAMGATRHAIEDLALMRALPGMMAVVPGDPIEAPTATRAVAEDTGPCYLRLGEAGESIMHQTEIPFELGITIHTREDRDTTLICSRGILQTAVRTAQRPAGGNQTRWLSMHTLKPFDTEAVLAAARETRAIPTLGEQRILGGLRSAVAEVPAEADIPRLPFRKIGVPAAF